VRDTVRLLAATALAGVISCFVTFGRLPTLPLAGARHQKGIDAGYQTGYQKDFDARYQRGIALNFYWRQGMRVPQVIAAEAVYARSLGANAVSLSFPLYVHGSTAAAGPATPTPAMVGQAVSAAQSAGLAVYLRPLLDQGNLPNSRVWWTPTSLARWFDTYQAFLLPYARVAQSAGADGFYVGTEFTEFGHSPYWAALDAAVRRVYHGRLYYSANWQEALTNQAAAIGGDPVRLAIDAYPQMPVPPAGLRASWAAWARHLPKGTVLSEVGITPRAGAQYAPYNVWSDAPLTPQEQPAWYAAACNAVLAHHLGGIFFWTINVGQPLDVAQPQTDYSFVASPGAEAIKGCFSRLARLT